MKFKRILAQLQQRRVTRVAVIYSGVAWALLQVADVMFPIIGLSENAITMVLLLALAGFPVSLVLSWIFDFTSQGITHSSDAEIEIERFRLTPMRMAAISASMLLFILVGYLYLERLNENRLSLFNEESAPVADSSLVPTRKHQSDDTGRPSIAVLPFVNFSDVPDMEHFGDGMAEEILNLLAKLDELSVAARTSSFYFKDKNLDITSIARHLGVRYVLEGSVRHSGDQIRVTAQLIDASNGFHLWSETYDRDPSNIFTLQDDIGKAVVNKLQLVLSSESKGLLEREMSVDPDSYDYYLRGRDYLRRPGDATTIAHAEEMFRKATEISPDYADAFAGLCDTLLHRYSMNFEKSQFDAAESACQQAQALGEQSPAVHIALGNLYRESGQFALAEREFNHALSVKSTAIDAYIGLALTFIAEEKYTLAEQTLIRAIEMEPNNWSASMAMGRFLFMAGRIEESVRYFERIDELMPESNSAITNLGSAYFLLGRFGEAASAFEDAMDGEPTSTLYGNLGSSYFFLERYEEAANAYQKALTLTPESFESWGNLADAYRHSATQSDLAPPAYEKATLLVRRHLHINPSDAFAIAALGHYLACMGIREEALDNTNLAQKLARKDMYVYYFSATALCALNEQQQALDAVGDALSLGYPAHMVQADAGLNCLKGLPALTEVIAKNSKQQSNSRKEIVNNE